MALRSVKELIVYQKGYPLAMKIFELPKRLPAEERDAFTGQIRRSARSICMNLREAWAKRRYRAYFVSKLTDCNGENGETDTSLDLARDCGCLTPDEHRELVAIGTEVGKMLGATIRCPDPFLLNENNNLP